MGVGTKKIPYEMWISNTHCSWKVDIVQPELCIWIQFNTFAICDCVHFTSYLHLCVTLQRMRELVWLETSLPTINTLREWIPYVSRGLLDLLSSFNLKHAGRLPRGGKSQSGGLLNFLHIYTQSQPQGFLAQHYPQLTIPFNLKAKSKIDRVGNLAEGHNFKLNLYLFVCKFSKRRKCLWKTLILVKELWVEMKTLAGKSQLHWNAFYWGRCIREKFTSQYEDCLELLNFPKAGIKQFVNSSHFIVAGCYPFGCCPTKSNRICTKWKNSHSS